MHLSSSKYLERTQGLLSWVLTLIFLGVFYLAMDTLALPDATMVVPDFEEIPLEIINLDVFHEVEPKPESQPIEQEDIVRPVRSQTPQRKFDLANLSEELAPPDQRFIDRPKMVPNAYEHVNVKPELDLETPDDGPTTIDVPTESFVNPGFPIPQASRGTEKVLSSVPLKAGNSSNLNIQDTGYEIGQPDISAPGEKNLDEVVINVPLLDTKAIGDEFANLAPIYKKLIEWMKRNPAELSSVVKSFMGYEQHDLTSRERFTAEGRDFDIFLICQEQQYEIRICLVEKNTATLLIDKGFKKQSNYFRIGTVSRDRERGIFSFETSQESPADQRTREFYRIFLSWWEQVKER